MRTIYVSVAFVLAACVAVAQGPQNQGKGGMMGHRMGMMAGMHDPMHEAVAIAFGLPQMKAELGLSTQQESQLRQFKEELVKKGQEFSTQIAAKNKELDAAASASRNETVKQILEQVGNLRAQMQFAVFETAGKMKGVLTESQRTKVASQAFHRAMMMNMTVGEMAQMMQFMGGVHMMGQGMMGMRGMMMGGSAPK